MVHEFGCTACAFMIHTDDQDELVAIVQDHADAKHDMELMEDDILEQVQTR